MLYFDYIELENNLTINESSMLTLILLSMINAINKILFLLL